MYMHKPLLVIAHWPELSHMPKETLKKLVNITIFLGSHEPAEQIVVFFCVFFGCCFKIVVSYNRILTVLVI